MPARAAPTFYGDDMTVPEQVCWAGTGGYAMVNFSLLGPSSLKVFD